MQLDQIQHGSYYSIFLQMPCDRTAFNIVTLLVHLYECDATALHSTL